MGLVHKRILQEYQSTPYSEWKKKFDAVCGFEMPMEVKWDTMHKEQYQERDQYFKWFGMVYFNPLLEVFKQLCVDDMGKEAVKASVKKIIISNGDVSSSRGSKFEDGVFHLVHSFHTNVDQEKERITGWRKLLESKM